MTSIRKKLLTYLAKRRPVTAFLLSARTIGIKRLVLALRPESPLYREGTATQVELAMDEVITPFVLVQHEWQPEEVSFFKRNAPSGPCLLVDMGANIGLVTRQLLHQIPAIQGAVCFEPDPGNHELLCRNLKHLPQCTIVNAAVGNEEGVLEFYEDSDNYGNYSLNIDSMRGRNYQVSQVRCLKATEEHVLGGFPAAFAGYPLVWKSDTQGFDEVIATALPDSFWDRVHVGIMELCRIDKPAVSYDRLKAILGSFPYRVFSDAPGVQVDPDAIVTHCQGRDGSHKDLMFSREPIRF